MNDIKSSITETHERWHRGHIEPFWNTASFSQLKYELETFNNEQDLIKWKRQGYVHPASHYTGMLCDMRKPQTKWNDKIIDWFEHTYDAKDVGSAYYRMGTGVILPLHGDTYSRYRKLFNCKLEDCFRAVVFLQDWASGHYFEIDGTGITNWSKGDYVFWRSDVKHMASNIGIKKRFTLQLTGHA